MKRTLLISFLLFQFSVFAQNNSKWSIGIEYSADDLSISDNRGGISYIITDGNINGYIIDFNKNNYSFGLTARYLIKKKLSISSGILYSNKDFTGTYNCATCGFYDPFPETIEQKFLVIPISINYMLLTGKLRPIINGGIKNNLNIINDLKEQSKNYFLETFIGASVYYEFSKNWMVEIGYNFQIALTDLYKTDEFNLKTNNFLLQINYTFKTLDNKITPH